MKPLAIPLAIALFCPSPVFAAWEEVPDDSDCAVIQSFELGSSIIIGKSKTDEPLSDEAYIAFFNDSWSLKEGDEIKEEIKLLANDGSWLKSSAVAMDNGFLIYTELKWVKNFRSVSDVGVFKGKERIGAYNWDLFFLGLSRLDSCIAKVRAPILEQQRLESVRKATPLDPFAKSADANKPPKP